MHPSKIKPTPENIKNINHPIKIMNSKMIAQEA